MISMIVAMDEQGLIGSDNRLPWHFPEDLQYFKAVTQGHDLLMGRRTFESILSYRGKTLPNRHHYVLSTTKSYQLPEVSRVKDLEAFLADYPPRRELFVIGGASVYRQALPRTQRLYLTRIPGKYTGETYFPEVDWTQWKSVRETCQGELKFIVYERNEWNG
jgi:dihydrofolate reductase